MLCDLSACESVALEDHNPFSSLLIGMCFATRNSLGGGPSGHRCLSVPFSSGCALRPGIASSARTDITHLSVPFSSGCALRRWVCHASCRLMIAFSSLLIGMCFATGKLQETFRPGAGPFSSLLIGMCFATSWMPWTCAVSFPFSSLLIGMCFATDK